jgi:hypothetical protein
MSDDIPLAWFDISLLFRLMGHPKNYAPGDIIDCRTASEQLGYWAHVPVAQWVLSAKLDGRLPVGDGADEFKKACRKVMEAQSRVIAAYNDAAVQRRRIILTR